MVDLKTLNDTQKEQARDLIKYYKFLYICKSCKDVYGSDSVEKNRICPKCESKSIKKRKKKDAPIRN